jgi:hypothetical protein
MRFLLKVSLPVEPANAAIKNGSWSKKIQSILAEVKPEAAYFSLDNGKRTAFLFVHAQDASQLPAMAEPWFLAFNADIECQPAMNAEDLAKAAPGFEQAVKKYS